MADSVPQFVQIVRQIIPKEGIDTRGKPSRVKAKVRKALQKAGYRLETIRGVGQKLGDYVVVYEEGKDNIITATFERYDAQTKRRNGKSKGRKKNASPLLTGIHPSISHYTNKQFTEETVKLLPDNWVQKPHDAYRWLSTDMVFLHKTQHTPETAADYLINLANKHLSGTINYTIIAIGNNHIVGLGPAN